MLLSEQDIARLHNGSLNKLLKHALRDSAYAKEKDPVIGYLSAKKIAHKKTPAELESGFIAAIEEYKRIRTNSFLFKNSEAKRNEKLALISKILESIRPGESVQVTYDFNVDDTYDTVEVSSRNSSKSFAASASTASLPVLELTEAEVSLLRDGQLKKLLEKSLKVKGSDYATSPDPILDYLKSIGITLSVAAAVEQKKEEAVVFIHNKVDAVSNELYGLASVDRSQVKPGIGQELFEALFKLRRGKAITVAELDSLRKSQVFRNVLELGELPITSSEKLTVVEIWQDTAFNDLLAACGYDRSNLRSGALNEAEPDKVERSFENIRARSFSSSF